MTVKEYDLFTCLTCKDGKQMERPEMVAHLNDAHNLKSPLQGVRSMIIHADGTNYFKWSYLWKFGDVEIQEDTCNRRSRASIKFWK